ncbi:Serine/arginine-rich splicing factor SR45a [Zea mays]|uniref:Serine/arginine-rich splicing factor SR45a n=1 Tax=Zea mays TaxID=4577 RepID=A0A1D6J8H9_MAIZE|nr:Serine/arginine-rich splicing factor SR45a [Zea mays]
MDVESRMALESDSDSDACGGSGSGSETPPRCPRPHPWLAWRRQLPLLLLLPRAQRRGGRQQGPGLPRGDGERHQGPPALGQRYRLGDRPRARASWFSTTVTSSNFMSLPSPIDSGFNSRQLMWSQNFRPQHVHEEFVDSTKKAFELVDHCIEYLVYDPWTRESRGFGFVTMAATKEADHCIKYLDCSVLQGQVIIVEKECEAKFVEIQLRYSACNSCSYVCCCYSVVLDSKADPVTEEVGALEGLSLPVCTISLKNSR